MLEEQFDPPIRWKKAPDTLVSEAAYIVGDVVIGEGTSIWPGAVIRADYGDIIIGKDCSIQDNAVLHTDDHLELGDNVLLTHGAVVHGGKVGSNVLIGVNAVLLEDTDVGDHVFIGAGAIVRGKVPDNSLVIGVPGQIRPLSEKQAAAEGSDGQVRSERQALRGAGFGSGHNRISGGKLGHGHQT